jgi:HSP20 family protein
VSNLTQQVKQGAEQALASLCQGWRALKDRASGALTRFQGSSGDASRGDELPSLGSWGFMAADVADSKDSVIVRLEAPGMSRSDFRTELRGEMPSIHGDKRIEREFAGEGYCTIQSAYGASRRDVVLPTTVDSDKTKATYRDGVLRVVLPKTDGAGSRRFSVAVK